MDQLSRLVARADIHDVLLRYARAVDRRDFEALRDCFHVDFHDDHGDFTGGVDAFIDWVSERHANVPFAAHLIGNVLVEFLTDDVAAAETYWVTLQRRPKSKAADEPCEEVDTEIIGRYLDRFERRDGIWKVARRRVVYDSSRFAPSTFRPPLVGILGTRDRSDPSFELFSSPPRAGSD